jgi:hypothetical protein
MNTEQTNILAMWRKFPDCIPGGDTRKILIAIKVAGRAGEEVDFDTAWWYAPMQCFKYLQIEDANHRVLYWMELPRITIS